ncbi:hypothetical protein [Streptomyces sp. NPDC002521]
MTLLPLYVGCCRGGPMSTRAVGLGVQRRPWTLQNGLWETVPGLHRELLLRLLSELVAQMVTAAGRGGGEGDDGIVGSVEPG